MLVGEKCICGMHNKMRIRKRESRKKRQRRERRKKK
jgi:hypothetical protein